VEEARAVLARLATSSLMSVRRMDGWDTAQGVRARPPPSAYPSIRLSVSPSRSPVYGSGFVLGLSVRAALVAKLSVSYLYAREA
jgi:hypothetical protein